MPYTTVAEASQDRLAHRARKRHRCARQVYWDRLRPESREWRGATECPVGGYIEPGAAYIQGEGEDPFHPSRVHPECEAAQW